MADDIVAIINAQLAICQASPCDCTCPILIDAAAEIERLRAAGDALALSIETFVPGVLVHISIKQAFTDWQEARRG